MFGQWNPMRMDFHPGRHRGRNYYRQNQGRFQNPNFHNHWNRGFMNMNDCDPTNCPWDFRPGNGNYKHPPMRQNQFGGGPRRFRRVDNREFNPSRMKNEDCFVNPGGFKKQHNNRNRNARERSMSPKTSVDRLSDIFGGNRERSMSPKTSVDRLSDIFGGNRFDDYYSSPYKRSPSVIKSSNDDLSPFKRTIRAENKRDHLKIQWPSDSESDSKTVDDKSEGELVKKEPVTKRDKQLISMIWGDESDNEDKSDPTCKIFKYSSETLPKFDGKTVVGDEGVFEMKVFRCTFCNIICMDKEKSKEHMLTKYHYNHYRDYMTNYEEDHGKEKEK